MTTPVSTPPALALPTDPTLLEQQNAVSTPVGSNVATVTSPINPAANTGVSVPNFDPDVYDLDAESHLMRLMKVLLGDAGAGQLRKRMTLARLEMSLFATQFLDIDTFGGGIFSYGRMAAEKTAVSPYSGAATNPVWQQQAVQDDSYRSRLNQFMKSINLGATKRGLAQAAMSITGVHCDIYEVYVLIDENGGSNPGGSSSSLGAQTYGDLETNYVYYEAMEAFTYSDLEGGVGTIGRTTSQNRYEVIVTPRKTLTSEEVFILYQVLTALKPAGALLTIDNSGVEITVEIPMTRVGADSTYWEVRKQVAPTVKTASLYPATTSVVGEAVEMPGPPLLEYQGEAWSYNYDYAGFSSYTETSPGVTGATSDYQQFTTNNTVITFSPDKAIESYADIMAGRSVSDGILTAAPYPATRAPLTTPPAVLDIVGAGVA